MNRKFLLYFAIAVIFSACNGFDDAAYKTIIELVPQTNSKSIGVEGGEAEIIVYATGSVMVESLNDFSGFASINKTSFSGDDTLRVIFDQNTGYRRMAKVRLVMDGGTKVDTLRFLQDGKTLVLDCAKPYATVDGSTESLAEFSIQSDVILSSIKPTVSYGAGASNWIADISVDDNILKVSTLPTGSEHNSRATVHMEYFDGWDEDMSLDLIITASNKYGSFGTKVGFDYIKEIAGQGEIKDECYLEGVIVSDPSSANMEFNPSTTYKDVDITENARTAYLQAVDGSVGLRIKYSDPSENTLAFGSKVLFGLQGLAVEKDADADCYTVYNASKLCVLENDPESRIPEKVKKVQELTDSDIFTFVEIPNTEFVWKDGCYANVYENYTLRSKINESCTSNNNRFDGWATLLVDDYGKAIYAPINMLCLWRRPGVPVPQGSGSVKGIVVHNTLPRYGNVGRYQIRVIDEKGFCQDSGAAHYTVLAEFTGKVYQYKVDKNCWASINTRYSDPGGSRLTAIIPSDDISADHTTPNAELYTENQSKSTSNPYHGIYYYFSHNSMIVNGDSGKAGDRGRTSNSAFNDGKACALEFSNDIKGWFKWSGKQISGYNGVVIRTSTKNITGSNLYLAYAFSVGRLSAVTSQFFPAHWCTEYSIDGGKTWSLCCDTATGSEFVHVHSLPWKDENIGGVKYFTAQSCGLGSTEHISMIPADAFGIDELLLKIRPYDNVMSCFPLEWNGESENSQVYYNTTADVELNFEYIQISYKK